jgi:hypothetical protein
MDLALLTRNERKVVLPHSLDVLMMLISHSRYNKSSGCLEWISSLTVTGYARFQSGQGHRAMYELCYGLIPRGLVIDHVCSNKKCVNPFHLEAVTQQENVIRGYHRRIRKTECVRGHYFDEQNTYVFKDGRRMCKQCRSIHYDKYYAKLKLRNTNNNLSKDGGLGGK